MILVKSLFKFKYRQQLASIVFILSFISLLTYNQSRKAIVILTMAALSHTYYWLVLESIVWLAFGIVFNSMLSSLKLPWLEWSLFHSKSNILLVPLKWRWLWFPYTILIAACIPITAYIEELIFRNDTHNWVKGFLWGTLSFGIMHLISGVSVRMVIFISLTGAMLVELYMLYGLAAVFVMHSLYNLDVVLLFIVESRLIDPLSKRFKIIGRWTNQLDQIQT